MKMDVLCTDYRLLYLVMSFDVGARLPVDRFDSLRVLFRTLKWHFDHGKTIPFTLKLSLPSPKST
jgi:hypothetical protein